MAKIKSIEISGLRGVRNSLILDLNNKSLLIYGDNGAGKSSITDSLEWFFYDRIGHLCNEEIGRKKGRDALRNIFIKDAEAGFIKLSFDNAKLDAKKSIDGSLKSYSSNSTDYFRKFISVANSERLILRYRDLVQFIIAGKTEKLTEIQRIIGFSEVANIRSLLKKNAGRISRNIKAANYDNQKNVQQKIIHENLGQTAFSDENFFDGVNSLIKPLNLDIEIKTRKDIYTVLHKIETKEDYKLLSKINFFTKLWEGLTEVEGNIDSITESHKLFYKAFNLLQENPEKVKNLQLLNLLKEGKSIISKDVIEDSYCPLCQQAKTKIDLLLELNLRIEELEILEKEKEKVERDAESLKTIILPNISLINGLLKDKLFDNEENSKLRTALKKIKSSLNLYSEETIKELGDTLLKTQDLQLVKVSINKIVVHALKTIQELTESKEANLNFKIYTKLYHASKAYEEYLKVAKEHHVLTRQQITLELLYQDFIKRQERALNIFLSMFSKEINDYYTTMNPNEKVQDFKLVPIKQHGELTGITIQFNFFAEAQKPPIAYLSESHINGLGLSFFLASVKAYNKHNKFFMLDDVISGFDRSHRNRFAKLIAEKFSDYQVILLTHEKEFFDLVSNEVKSKGWITKTINWNKETGTEINLGLIKN